MAFRILSDEEKSFLTDEQRKSYESELEMKKKREAFVERLTELENAEIKPYTPSLKTVNVIKNYEPVLFKVPERQYPQLSHEKKLELNNNMRNNIIGNFETFEKIKVDLSSREQINFNYDLFLKTCNFKGYEQQNCFLTKGTKPIVPSLNFEKSGAIALKPLQINKVPKTNIQRFIAPEKQSVIISKNIINGFKAKDFLKPKKPDLDLTSGFKSEIKMKQYKQVQILLDTKNLIKNKPDTQNIINEIKCGLKTKEIKPFVLPKLKRENMNLTEKFDFPVKSFEKPIATKVELPIVCKPCIKNMELCVHIQSDLNIENYKMQKTNIKKFESPDRVEVKIPELNIIKPITKTFVKCQNIQPKIDISKITFMSITDFKKPKMERPDFSNKKKCKCMEIGTKVNEILSMLDKETVL